MLCCGKFLLCCEIFCVEVWQIHATVGLSVGGRLERDQTWNVEINEYKAPLLVRGERNRRRLPCYNRDFEAIS